MSIPEKLRKWAEQPGAVLTDLDRGFCEMVADYADARGGYGFMQQVIEWLWQERAAKRGSPGSASGPESHGKEIAALEAENARLRGAIAAHHAQKADDRCWMDDNVLYAAAGLPEDAAHRCVGDKAAMLKNCERFVEVRCREGQWLSYAELEAENAKLRAALAESLPFVTPSVADVLKEFNGSESAKRVNDDVRATSARLAELLAKKGGGS